MSHHDAAILDRRAYAETAIHSLDPRAKTLATLAFIVTVVSFPRYEVAGLLPFFLFPVVMIVLGDVPPGVIARRTLLALPFALMVGLFNPLIDREPALWLGRVAVSGGWLSLVSLLVRCLLSVSAGLALVATTSFPEFCRGLTRMGVPSPLVTQLLFLYRYLFVLSEESTRLRRARDLRAGTSGSRTWRLASSVIASLFIRTLDRAERIHQAMVARGFDGEVRMIRRLAFGPRDWAFLTLVVFAALFLRLFPVAGWLGRLALGLT